MGCGQSTLKKELATLKEAAAASKTKHADEVEALKSEKRMLEYKLKVLEELAAKAQLEAEKANQLASESEERMKALKWELVRKLSVATSGSPSSSSSFSTRSSLSSLMGTSSPRVSLSWKLKDPAALRRSESSSVRSLTAENQEKEPTLHPATKKPSEKDVRTESAQKLRQHHDEEAQNSKKPKPGPIQTANSLSENQDQEETKSSHKSTVKNHRDVNTSDDSSDETMRIRTTVSPTNEQFKRRSKETKEDSSTKSDRPKRRHSKADAKAKTPSRSSDEEEDEENEDKTKSIGPKESDPESETESRRSKSHKQDDSVANKKRLSVRNTLAEEKEAVLSFSDDEND